MLLLFVLKFSALTAVLKEKKMISICKLFLAGFCLWLFIFIDICPVTAAQLDCINWNTKQFFEKATKNDIFKCIKLGKDSVKTKNEFGWFPLHTAVRWSSNPEVIEALSAALMNANANLNVKDKNGWTPLHLAVVKNDNLMIMDSLLKALEKARADLNVKDKKGWTPLHWAAFVNQLDKVKKLVKSGAEVNAQAKNGSTPLHWAATNVQNKQTELVDFLKKNRADVNAKDKFGWTPLHYVVQISKTPIVGVNALLKVGANRKISDRIGKVASYYAKKNPELYKILNDR